MVEKRRTSMSTNCVSVPVDEAEELIAVLRDAEEDDDLIRAALRDPTNQAYAAWKDQCLVGAAVVRWIPGLSSEILYIAVVEEQRGQGHGRAILRHVIAELPAHGRRLMVGTANSSLDNIAFYQRCGFRLKAVKRDHFAYVRPQVSEFGIVMRDMIVFSYELSQQEYADPAPTAVDSRSSEGLGQRFLGQARDEPGSRYRAVPG
jgi:ribosomal protein S18 acetylase RimI-like enzyme